MRDQGKPAEVAQGVLDEGAEVTILETWIADDAAAGHSPHHIPGAGSASRAGY
jgi:hypothetical protein